MTPYDLVGKEISWSFNWKDQEAHFKQNNRIYRLYYPNLWGEDVSVRTSYSDINMRGKLKNIDHSYFVDEDSLTTNEKYVFIFGENCKAVVEWDIHYNDVDQIHIAEFQLLGVKCDD